MVSVGLLLRGGTPRLVSGRPQVSEVTKEYGTGKPASTHDWGLGPLPEDWVPGNQVDPPPEAYPPPVRSNVLPFPKRPQPPKS